MMARDSKVHLLRKRNIEQGNSATKNKNINYGLDSVANIYISCIQNRRLQPGSLP